MWRASWNGAVLAESDQTVSVERNQYFPPKSVNWDYFQPSDTHTVCHWKGLASYYTVVVGDKANADAAWFYPEPKPAAAQIRNRIAFWHGVKVQKVATEAGSGEPARAGALRQILDKIAGW
jgi:uncharacterized protein (DUF427 family)